MHADKYVPPRAMRGIVPRLDHVASLDALLWAEAQQTEGVPKYGYETIPCWGKKATQQGATP